MIQSVSQRVSEGEVDLCIKKTLSYLLLEEKCPSIRLCRALCLPLSKEKKIRIVPTSSSLTPISRHNSKTPHVYRIPDFDLKTTQTLENVPSLVLTKSPTGIGQITNWYWPKYQPVLAKSPTSIGQSTNQTLIIQFDTRIYLLIHYMKPDELGWMSCIGCNTHPAFPPVKRADGPFFCKIKNPVATFTVYIASYHSFYLLYLE